VGPASLSYLDQGAGAVVLLVHGSNVDHRIWAEHGDILSRRYRVVAPTQRYFGNAAWTDNGANFSIKTHADDLATFIGTMNVAPATIVGWSYGAAVSLAMATLHPGLCNRMFLYEPTLATFVSDPSAFATAARDREEMFSAARAKAVEGHNETAVRLFMDGVNGQEGSFMSLPAGAQQVMRENSRMLPLLFSAPRPPQITCEDLGRLEMSVAVALGGDSRPFYRIVAEWAARCIPGARLLPIPGARHLWPIQNPGAFSQAVLGFLEGSARAEAGPP
jgi:pimeloyl-ACP methyl ester carboxylesterase